MAQAIDYNALAEQARQAAPAASGQTDYDALAAQARGGSGAEGASGSSTGTPTPSTPGLLDQLASWGAKAFPYVTDADEAKENPSFGPILGTVDQAVSNLGNSALRGLTSLPAGAVDWVEGAKDLPNQVMHPLDTMRARLADNAAQPGTVFHPGQASQEPSGRDLVNYGADTLGGLVPSALMGEAVGGMLKIPGAMKDALRGDVDAPIQGTSITPRQRFEAAKRVGVRPDVADATGAPLFAFLKRTGEDSALGGFRYDRLKTQNTSALSGTMDSFLNEMYPKDREAGGAEIQDALKRDQAGLQTRSTQGFDSLPQDIELPGLEQVGKRAQDIARENAGYHEMFPSMTPNRAMGVVGDVGGLGPQPPPPVRMSPFVDENGTPIPSASQAAPRKPQSFSTAQKLRSDLLEFGRKNPDIVAGQGDAMVRELAGGVDDAMTGGSSDLTPAQLKTFRAANEDWRDMKETYDDPSSPYYHAVRTDNPSTLFSGVGPRTPENARSLVRRLSPFGEEAPSPALGAVRRGTVESALKPTAEEGPNYKNFALQLHRIPADYRAELFDMEQNQKLRDLASTSNMLGKDFNPSGTAKQGQRYAEMSAMTAGATTALSGHPLVGASLLAEPLAQYPLAKFVASPEAAEWLMKPAAAPNPFVAPAATAGAFAASRRKASNQ